MKHVGSLSLLRKPAPGETTPLEQLILTVFGVYFRDWDNFPSVFSNLQKYYSKTA
ncbi:MAG TPA: hypothetical protein HPP77_05885 [Candidatus Hydrogenedentes bacterium]|nr:hypothetical protein [Candidatus Hydrogenedentota bacterium]HIJ73459.1 hypothetical protein [Candidatus Hydrogenedentota bacterium]